ncbi:MAG TPA: hypothetical protein VEZ26_09565 [Sphingomonadaceae bacterium]|nr:hypothetical protein [Sphingomonadaceae bacterium]
MRSSHHLHRRLGRITALQALKTMASQGELAEAQAATSVARAGLAEREREVAAKQSEVASLLDAEALDFAGWRIALAVLGELSASSEIAAAETRDCERQEVGRREQWRQDHTREERAKALLRKVSRRMADKRDDAAMLEMASLRSQPNGEKA